MKTLYGNAACDQLAAGNPIYYREPGTPAGLCLKEYPDGHRELVKFSLAHGEEFVSEASPRLRLGLLAGKLSVGDGCNDPPPGDLLELFEAQPRFLSKFV